MLTTFETYEAFAGEVAARLPAGDAQFREAVISGVAAGDSALRGASASTELELRVGPWFLRDDDTPYFESAGMIASVSAALLAGGGVTAQGAVAAATTVAAATWKVWRKGGRLSREEMSVVTALEQRGPLSEEELETIVGPSIRTVLDRLADVELRDGSSARLVRRTGDGRWRSLGV